MTREETKAEKAKNHAAGDHDGDSDMDNSDMGCQDCVDEKNRFLGGLTRVYLEED